MEIWRQGENERLAGDPYADGWRPSLRYPDPAIEVLDDRFLKYRLALASVERLAEGCRWSEGPVWFGDQRCLIWSDIPNNRLLRFDEESGQVSTFRRPSNFANGNTRDRQGRLVTCEHGGRRLTRTEHDGALSVLAETYGGKKLNSPNDVVVKSDGTIWFTDPPFGISSNYEGHKATPELSANVYRLGTDNVLNVVVENAPGPNGLAFSPDESRLYLVESRATPNRLIVAYDVIAGGTQLANRRIVVDAGPGTPDGLRIDGDGNLWCGWGMDADLDGVRVFTPDGHAIGHVHLPERCANLCFGGRNRDRLFMAASHSLYALHVNVQGAVAC